MEAGISPAAILQKIHCGMSPRVSQKRIAKVYYKGEMRPKDVVVTAWTTMLAHKLRSFLALLGLVMGVATLITVMTLVQGANSYVEHKIANLGTRVFQVQKTPAIPTDFNEFLKALRNKNIAPEDLEAVRERCPHCEAVGAQMTGGIGGKVHYRD